MFTFWGRRAWRQLHWLRAAGWECSHMPPRRLPRCGSCLQLSGGLDGGFGNGAPTEWAQPQDNTVGWGLLFVLPPLLHLVPGPADIHTQEPWLGGSVSCLYSQVEGSGVWRGCGEIASQPHSPGPKSATWGGACLLMEGSISPIFLIGVSLIFS